MNFRLRELRGEKGITQKELARVLNVCPQTVGYYENSVNMPTPEMLIKIADYFDVTVDYLLGLEGGCEDLGKCISSDSKSTKTSCFQEEDGIGSTFSVRLKELRNERQLTQKRLSEILSLSKNTICEYEKGRAEPSLDCLLKLSDIFEVSVDYLIGKSSDFEKVKYSSAVEGLTQEEREILRAFRGLFPKQRKLLLQFINSCIQ